MGTPSSIRTIYSRNSEIEDNTKSMKSDSTPDIMKQISSSRLRTCFEDIVKRIKVVFNLNTLEYILADLKINTNELDATLQQIIPYMLVSYIKSWPGWSKSEDYENGTLKLDEYYEKFHKYVTFKLTYLIQKGYQKAIIELQNESQPKEMVTKEINPCLQKCVEIQCQSEDLVGIKSFSAFSIDIEGPPKLLNTLIFGDQQNDVVMKMHAIKAWTSELSIQTLVNWPFIEIEFTSPFIKFSRKIIPNYIRYLSRADTITKLLKQDFIETVQVNPEVSRTIYSRKFLKKYLLAYSLFLKSKNLSADKITEITVIFSQLIRDIEELGSVCQSGIYDSTTISFNIGGCRYLRNKKTAGVSISDNPNAPIVGYSEVLTPRCSLKLIKNEYTEQAKSIDSTGKTPLSMFFNSVQKQLLRGEYRDVIETLPNIMYSCFFCKKEYGGIFAQSAILNHFHNDHCMEHALMCCECKKQYNALMLIKTRWFHRCESNPTAKNPMADIVIN